MIDQGGTPTRRTMLVGTGIVLGATAAGLIPGHGRSAILPPTPTQTAGPFYPPTLPADMDADLVRLSGRGGEAMGTVSQLTGRVLNIHGEPLPDSLIDIWQCDANGRYIHPADRGPRARDQGFQGFGRTRTGSDGGYRFRTIRPVPYGSRTPHIHFAVRAPGHRVLVTQMYVKGEERNSRDFLFRRLAEAERTRLLVDFRPAPDTEDAALAGRFDLVLVPD